MAETSVTHAPGNVITGANTGANTGDTTGATTADAFLADRMNFWHRFTGFTLKTTVSLIVFCAWLWWCAFAGFSLFHIVVLPIVVGILVMIL